MELPTPALADLDNLLSRLGGEEALSASARAHGAFRRAREVKTATALLRLVLMYGPGGLSLRTAAAVAAEGGLCDISDVALLKRIRHAAAWLEALCAEQIGLADAAPGDVAGAINLVDASVIKSPGTGTDYRLHLRWDVTRQRSVAARITTTAVGERLDLLCGTATGILIGDRGYPQPDGLRNTLDSGAEVLVRLTWNSLSLTGRDDQPLDWLALCAQAHRAGSVDIPVLVRKAHRRFEPLPMRLVFIPKPAEAAATARKAAERASRKAQRKQVDPGTLACADHLILLTSLPPARFNLAQLGALYRLCWQIELLFKRLKSLLHLDRLPAKDPALAQAWLHAHLLIALLAEDCIADKEAFPPSAGPRRRDAGFARSDPSGLDLALIRHGGARHPRCGAPDTAIQPDHSLPPPSPTPRAAATAAVAGGRILKLAPMRTRPAMTGKGADASQPACGSL